MTKPEITDETDCPFLVLAVVYPGEPLELVGKRGEKGSNQAQAASKG